MLRTLEAETTFRDVQQSLGPAVEGGHSFAQIAESAAAYNIQTFPVEVPPGRIPPAPCIIQLKHSPFVHNSVPAPLAHFIVLLKSDQHGVVIADPPFPLAKIPNDMFLDLFTGNALYFAKDQDKANLVRQTLGWHHSLQTSLLQYTGCVLLAIFVALVSTRVFVYFFSLATACTVLPAILFLTEEKATGISVPQTLNLGILEPGRHEITIPILNRGAQEEVIEQISSSCSCVVSSPPGTVPAMKQKAAMVNVSVREGHGEATIVFMTKSGKRESVNLNWRGRSGALLVPPRVFQKLASGERFARKVQVLFAKGAEFSFLGVEDTSDKFLGILLPAPDDLASTGKGIDMSSAIIELTTNEPTLADCEEDLFLSVSIDGKTHRLKLPVKITFNDAVPRVLQDQ